VVADFGDAQEPGSDVDGARLVPKVFVLRLPAQVVGAGARPQPPPLPLLQLRRRPADDVVRSADATRRRFRVELSQLTRVGQLERRRSRLLCVFFKRRYSPWFFSLQFLQCSLPIFWRGCHSTNFPLTQKP